MDYRIIKLKLSDFEKEYIYEDEENKIIAKYEDGITKKALYKYDLNEKIKDKFDKVNKKKIKKNIETKLLKIDPLSDEERQKQVKQRLEKSLNDIKSKIIRQEENRVVLRDTELIRIIRILNFENNNIEDNGYININDIVCVSISTPIYKSIQNGIIEINGNKFIRLMASSGNVRNKKVFFVSLNLYDKAIDILLCGLSKELKHNKISKYNAYMGLPNSDTIPVSTPRIIVISDYKNKIKGTYNVVTKLLNGTFDYKPDQKDELKNMPFDGAGVCSVEIAKQWQEDLKLDYIPSSFQFRAIIGVKGNLYVMDIKKYISEMVEENKRYIIDAWGNRQEVINADGELIVDAILTESQFKFKDYYKNFEEWKEAFETDLHGYHRTFNIAKWGNKENKNKALLSYQPIQSLVLTDEEIKELCEPTIKVIDKISNNVNEFLKYRGLLQEEKNELGETILVDSDMDRVPPFYKALKKNKDLFKDKYIQKKVQADIKTFKENASKGMVFIEGQYQTLTIDLVGFMEFAMRQEVKGAVSANTVYSKYWLNKNKEIDSFNEQNKDNEDIDNKEKIAELDIIRFPAIAQEHCLVSVIQTENDWFKYIDDGIIVSMWDSNNQKLGSADSDGDRVLNTVSKVLINVVKRQPSNCILFKEEKLPVSEEDNNKKIVEPEVEPIAINNMKELIECDCRGMDASIGKVVNKTTILWSMDEDEQGLRNEYINVISVVGALVIDFVKTGVKEDVPENIEEFIKDINKPKFLKVKYKTLKQRQERVNKNVELVAKDEKELKDKKIELFSETNCTMNKLHDHINEELDKIKNKFPKDEFRWTQLLKYKKLNIDNDTYPLVVAKLKELKEEHDWITKKNSIDAKTFEYDSDKQMEKIDKYKYFYRYCKNQLINLNKECKKKDKLLDYVIYAFYADKDFAIKNEAKDILWNVFESELNTIIAEREFKNNEYNVAEDEEQFKDQMENLKIGKDKVKEKALQVSITGIDDIDNKIEVNFPKEKVSSLIDKLEISKNSKKVLMVLVMLDELYKANQMKLIIEQSKRGTLNKSALAKLTGLNIEKIQPSLKELYDNEFIELNMKNNKEKLGCEIVFKYENKGNLIKLKNSSSIQKNMKKVTFQK